MSASSTSRSVGHAPGADRRLVEEHRGFGRRGDNPVMTQHHVLIVAERPAHRWEQHDRIGAGRHGGFGLFRRSTGLFLVDAGDDQPIADDVAGNFDHPPFFLRRQKKILAGMAVDQKAPEAVDGASGARMLGERSLVDRRLLALHRTDGRGVQSEKTSLVVGVHARTP